MQFNERVCQNDFKTCKIESEKKCFFFFYQIGVNFIELSTKGHIHMLGLYELRICSDFIFPMTKFPFISINIAAYGVYILDAMRYFRAFTKSNDCVDSAQLARQKLLTQGYDAPRLNSLLRKLYYRHHGLLTAVNQNHVFFPFT